MLAVRSVSCSESVRVPIGTTVGVFRVAPQLPMRRATVTVPIRWSNGPVILGMSAKRGSATREKLK
jgi:hypothetical protein